MHRSKIFAAFIAASLALPAFAYEPGSHAEISFQAALKSDLDRTLKDRFGLVFGRDEFANGRTVADWIAHGGAWEDMPPKRALNHFHQPLRPWGDAGIFGTGRSSIYWQQDQSGFVAFFLGGDDWGWKKARARLANLFLGATAGEREQALADVSRSLGHMMHLLQDAHSPPHTRNDEHLTKTDGYEHHIEEVRMTDPVRFFQLLNGPVVQPADDIFQPTGDSNAPSPVARLIDTDTFFGDAFTYSNGGNIGGAEYTNGGYLSDDTIFQDFAMPRRESLLPDGFLEQTGILRRKYFAKSGDGDSVLHFVAEGVLFEALRFRGFKDTGLVLDDKIYEDYAANLMPRAVGYSAALIDYFFREQLEIAAPDRHVYGRAAYEPSKPDIGFGKFTSLRFKVRNRSRDSMTSGKLTAVIRYRKLLTGGGEVDSLKNPDSPISIAVFQAKSKPVPAFALDDSFQEQLFDFSADPLPVNAVDVRLVIVWQGPVGEVKEGVAIGVKDLMEPDPIDYTNASDWECFRGTLYNVGDATQFPDDASRDLDGDKRPDVVGPYFEVGLRLKTGSTSQPLPFPTDFSFDMKVPRLDATPAPQLIRVVVLQDAPAYFTSTWRDDVVFPFLGSVGPQFTAYVFGGQINDVIQIQGGPVHRITLPGQYRGNPFFNLIVAVEQKTIACLGQTSDLKPDTTFVSVPPLKVAP